MDAVALDLSRVEAKAARLKADETIRVSEEKLRRAQEEMEAEVTAAKVASDAAQVVASAAGLEQMVLEGKVGNDLAPEESDANYGPTKGAGKGSTHSPYARGAEPSAETIADETKLAEDAALANAGLVPK